MGASASKKVQQKLRDSSEFSIACDSIYDETIALAQHAFPGVLPYQIPGASARLHLSLSSFPLVRNCIPSPPTQIQIDRVLSQTLPDAGDGNSYLNQEGFKSFAVQLFTYAAVSNARDSLVSRIPAGMAVIGAAFFVAERIPGGIGTAVRSGRSLVGKAVAVYAVGIAGSVYLSLFR